jgi:glycosyltransferase 2 family protein
LKRWRNLAGSVFAILIMGVVLYLYGDELNTVDFSNKSLLPNFVGAVALYVTVVLIGAFGWRLLLSAFGATPDRWAAERQVLISQLGKYIPGNVAQYFGRAGMAMSTGVSAKTVGLAIVAETAAILIGGCLSVAAMVALQPELITRFRQIVPDVAALKWLAAALVLFLFLLASVTLALRFSKRLSGLPQVNLTKLMETIFLYVVAFIVLGWSFLLLVGTLSPREVPLPLTIAVFGVAWIAGLATPGAPGGLGVRESVLALGLAPFVGGATALSAAILYRGVSVLGDVISFGIGTILPKPHHASKVR